MSNASASLAAKINPLTITGKDGHVQRLDGKGLNLNYYESLLSPNITANLVFEDTGMSMKYKRKYDKQERSGSIYNALPITGGEELGFRIESKSGKLDFVNNPLYVNGSVNLDQESQRESVILDLVSKGAISNQESTVYKKYDGKISDNVRALISQFLETDNIQIDSTANSYSFTGNSSSVFDVLCSLASKSMPEKGNPGFFFYETKEGFNFRSIDDLISQGPVATYYKSDVLKANLKNDANDYKIQSFSIVKNQNLINSLKSGIYENRTIFFNPKTFEEEEIICKLDGGDGIIATQGGSKTIKLDTQLGKSAEKPNIKSFTRTHYDILDVGTLNQTPSGEETTGAKDWQAQSTMRYNSLFTQMVSLLVPCNLNLKAGDVIKCDFEIMSSDSKVQGSADPVQSGNYLILNLCHSFDRLRSYTSLTLIRDTYGLYNKNTTRSTKGGTVNFNGIIVPKSSGGNFL